MTKLGRKLRKEARRAVRKLRYLLALPELARLKRAWDRDWPAQLTLTEGAQPFGPRVAVLVLYQPEGLRASTLDSCDYLLAQGYVPLIVSNAPLSPADREALASRAALICERPNYGYDVGAYRDGVRLLDHLGQRPEHLALINDSLWFPLTPDNDLLARLEATGRFMGGLVRKTRLHRDRDHNGTAAGFIEAYFYHVNFTVPGGTEAFVRFWRDVPLTKGREFLRERRFSYAMTRAGVPMGALGSRHLFLTEMAALPTPELRKVLHYAAYDSPQHRARGTALLETPDHPEWRAAALRHIRRVVTTAPFYASFPYGSETTLRLGFLKRPSKPIYRAALQAYLRAVDAGDLPAPAPAIRAEIEAALGT